MNKERARLDVANAANELIIVALRERIVELEDLVTMIVDSESADASIIPYLHRVWLVKAKELKGEV